MKKLLEDVDELVKQEYGRAAEKFGAANNSPHESYAVIKEEVEEAADSAEAFDREFASYWEEVKNNKSASVTDVTLEYLQARAEETAAEWIQVAAMCQKARARKEAQS